MSKLNISALGIASFTAINLGLSAHAVTGNVNLEVGVDPAIALTIQSSSDGSTIYGESDPAGQIVNNYTGEGITAFGTSSAVTSLLPNQKDESMWSKVTVYTNNTKGYKLTVSDTDENTSLVSGSYIIPANTNIAAGTSAWAFKGGNFTEYTAMSPLSSALTIADSTNKSAKSGDTTEVHYGVSTSADQATGTYTDTIVYTVTGEDASAVTPPKSFAEDSWETIIQAVNNNDYPYKVGETKKIDMDNYGPQTIRIANVSECSSNIASKSACGFVLEFITGLEGGPINSDNTCSNQGGWGNSPSAEYINNSIYNSLPEPLKSAVITTSVISSHGSRDSGNFLTEHKLYLLSPEEVYGASFTSSNDSSVGSSRQLDYYAIQGTSTSNTSAAVKRNSNGNPIWWWSRSAQKDSYCYYYSFLHTGSYSNCYRADSEYYYAPAFRIK